MYIYGLISYPKPLKKRCVTHGVEQLLQSCARARMVVSEQPARYVREALLHHADRLQIQYWLRFLSELPCFSIARCKVQGVGTAQKPIVSGGTVYYQRQVQAPSRSPSCILHKIWGLSMLVTENKVQTKKEAKCTGAQMARH